MNQVDSDSTLFTRPDIGGFIQYVVEGGQPDLYGMSEVECIPGSSICIVESVMRAEFFASSGFVNVSGIATLQLGSSSLKTPSTRRRTRSRASELQTRKNKGIRQFSISFPITTYQETIGTAGPSLAQSFLLSSYLLLLYWLLRYFSGFETLED